MDTQRKILESENSLVNIEVNGITVQPAKKSKLPRISPFSEAQLLKGLTPHTRYTCKIIQEIV